MKLFITIMIIFLWISVGFGIYACIVTFNNPDAILGGIKISNGGFLKSLTSTIIYTIIAGFFTAVYFEIFVKETL